MLGINPGSHPEETTQYLDILDRPNQYKSRFDIQQYTGLKDKNGAEIYEGDICTLSCKYSGIKNQKAIVIFKGGCFCF